MATGGVTITARIDDDGLINRLKHADDATRARVKPLPREVSLIGVKRIKMDMPVDTGRARASWGVWTPGDAKADDTDAKESDAVFSVSGDGLTVIQGTNVPYVEELEKGSSQQAPAGFIEAAANAMADALMKRVSDILDGVI